MRTRLWSLLLVAALMLPALASADLAAPWVIFSPYAGSTIWDDDVQLQDNVLFGGRMGLMIQPWLGIEGTYGFSPTKTEFAPNWETDVEHLGADLVLGVFPNSAFCPYILGGWTQLKYDSDRANDTVTGGAQYFQGWEFGGGIRLRLAEGDVSRLDLRLDARDAYVQLTPSFIDNEDYRHNLLLTGGLQLTFGRTVTDSDGDGVNDRKDRCPGTPVGATVDRRGCPSDSDGDGVFDGIDLCANTPAKVLVDGSGCPLDSDGDGVFDGLDACPGTPSGATIDATGCPSDSDGDGVFDGIDLCNNTPVHLKVDKDGCPIEITEAETELLDTGMIRSNKILFEVNKSDLKPESHAVLDEIGETLTNWPDLRIEIGGHTDSQGSDAYNLKLSKQRAQAVLSYLSSKFPAIQVGQFSVVGYGETLPIASNDTVDGRAQNRRVEFKVLNTEILRKVIQREKQLER
jgi:OOP family OmpA-OmpF porin